jgi:interferon gamma-inducible protein 30
MMFALFSLLVVLAVAFADEYPKVKVELYYESLCPSCQAFITGPLTNTLALPDMVAIIDLKMVPYGNTKKNSDGTFTCQHGVDECTTDVLELCTLYKLSGNLTSISTGDTSYKAWPFTQCMEINEGDPSKAESCFSSTMANSGLSYSTVTDCAAKEASDVQNAGAAATPADHQYVPWVLIDGTLLEYTNLLQPTICKAYTGPAPASCKRLARERNEAVCMNK